MEATRFSSPEMKWNPNSNDVSKPVRAQEQLALPPRATEQNSHLSTATTLEISKTQDCHAMIQALMQPFISTCEEGKIRCVAVLMEEIAIIMQDCVRDRSPLSLSRIGTPDSQQKIPAPELPGQASIVSLDDILLFSNGGNQSQHELPPFSAAAFADATKQVSFAQSPQSSPHHTMQTQPLIAPGSDMIKGKNPLSRFAKSVRAIVPSKPEKRMRDAAEMAFAEVDRNKDGFLQKAEVLRAVIDFTDKFEDSHIADPARFVDSLLAEFDKDGDGRINFKEFLEMVKSPAVAVDKKENTPHLLSQASRFTANIFLLHKHNIENKVEGNKDDWVIHPMSNLHLAWDVLISILILVILVTLPLSFGWEEFANRLLFKTNLAIDAFFFVDLVKSFFTGIVDDNDVILLKFKYIVPTYLKGYFIFDLLSSVPLDLIFYLTHFMSGTARHSLKLLKLFRIAKLFRLRRVSQLFNLVGAMSLHLEEKLNFRLADGATKLVRLFTVAVISAHWIGCFNFMLVRTHGFPADSWVVHSGLEDERPVVQWRWAMFKALAQMILIGFETPPFTSGSCDTFSSWCRIEHWTTLGCLYIGAVFYSVLISSVLSIVQTRNVAQDAFEEKIVQVDGYMRMKGIPLQLREEVKKRLSHQHSNRQFYDEEQVLKLISPDHLKKIREYEALQLAKKVPMLADPANEAFKCALAKHLQQTVVYPDQVIFEERTTSDTMYFISSGLVELYIPSHDWDSYTVIGDGCFFGEVSLLQGIKRTTSAKAKTQCRLFHIKKPELLLVLHDFPEVEKFLNGVANSRRRRVQHFVRPSENPLSEQESYDSEDQRTEVFLQSKNKKTAGNFNIPAPNVDVQR